MPTEKDKYVKFKNFHKMTRSPYVIYADCEAILESV